MALFEWFIRGGVVMWPLLLCSLIALAIVIERTIFWLNLIPKHKAFLE
ncbi:MAG: MotA/TolQ/ExbB proton channel family protein, partial [Gemmatimonadaceae bacterium]|nr:MotA/TolQ/ExbB proton channel family protein [Gloeobacterales cyanobacterium ES-bin-141]